MSNIFVYAIVKFCVSTISYIQVMAGPPAMPDIPGFMLHCIRRSEFHACFTDFMLGEKENTGLAGYPELRYQYLGRKGWISASLV